MQTCQPQSNVSFTSNKVYFRKIPNDKYVNRKWVTYNEVNKQIHCSLCVTFTRLNNTP